MSALARVLQILHPLGTLAVLIGLALNIADFAELIALEPLLGNAAYPIRLAPLVGGAAVVLLAFMLAPDEP
ncbi:MAG: hypothetical protein AAFS10_16435 [Myxococcota bacterium]